MTSTQPAVTVPKKREERTPERFVAYIVGLCEAPRTRAELRRGLGLPVERCNYLHRYLVPWTHDRDDPAKNMHPATKRAHYAVAALIAARPRVARAPQPLNGAAGDSGESARRVRADLGVSLGQAVSAKVIKPATAESTLHLMSRQSADSVHSTLPSLTRQLLSGGIAVDWAVLLDDLAWWDLRRDRIGSRWLESYFRTAYPENDTETPSATEENER
ncbi:type I-E CRISPR-associated protein Cse2/CasB [Streptomyces qinzhouensis]|uniref:type I-E CRISPR-associated protein Cse2/CasB n=1 Tax=Streptomyces qinzhouensis TaxID=2599401 RepID=UPI0016466831|nr:type I-E CRISPR-associated protein Cse2/CasB [Streptomyces qinzhouensis]